MFALAVRGIARTLASARGLRPRSGAAHSSSYFLSPVAAALSPAYVRVSGTWANTVYFADSRNPPSKAPAGFSSVLTQREWKGVIDFVHAVKGELVTSFASGEGTRNSQRVWTSREAERWLAFTKSAGGQIAAAEFMNDQPMRRWGAPRKDTCELSVAMRDVTRP